MIEIFDPEAHTRSVVRETLKVGFSNGAIADAAVFSRSKFNAWVLDPNLCDINLRTARKVVIACEKLLKEAEDESNAGG